MQGVEELQMRRALSLLIKSFLSMLRVCSSLELCHYWYISALVELHSHTGEHTTHRHMPNTDGSVSGIVIPPSMKEIVTGKYMHRTIHFCCVNSDTYIVYTPGHVSVHELSCSEQYQLATFRELCGLLWLLHVRDKASHHLRQFLHSKVRCTGIRMCTVLNNFRSCKFYVLIMWLLTFDDYVST